MAVLLVACGAPEAGRSAGGGFPADADLAGATPVAAPAFAVDTVARGLEVPWAMAFAPDGRILVTERAGRVRVIEHDSLRAEPWAQLDVFAHDSSWQPESGLMGIALAPDFAETGHVYLYGTFRKTSVEQERKLGSRVARRLADWFAPARASRFENRVYRLTDRGGRGIEPSLVIGGLPANYYHCGGVVAFGPDGMMYLTTGDAMHPPSAARRGALAGKILRYRPDGGIPADNPHPGSPVYAAGLRNSQGLAWHPGLGALFAIDHGPTGMPAEDGRTGSDELNVITPGADYGWPRTTGRDTAFAAPVRVWGEAIAPAGLAVYQGPVPGWHGSLFITALSGRQLRRLVVAARADGARVVHEEPLLQDGYGRLRAVAAAPDGSIYVGTSNKDGRGNAGAADDMLLRLVPQVPRSSTTSPTRSNR